MRQVSKHNKYFDSDGNAYTQSQLNELIRAAKAQKLEQHIEEYGYAFCHDCKRNASGTRIDMSHTISVLWAKNNRQVELAFDVNNIELRCRDCHQKLDKLK